MSRVSRRAAWVSSLEAVVMGAMAAVSQIVLYFGRVSAEKVCMLL